MTLQENPSVISELKPIVEHFVSKSAGYSIEPGDLEDAYSAGFTGMLCSPEEYRDKKEVLNVLIAKTGYALQASRNVRRKEDRFRAAMPVSTDETGSWTYPEQPESNRRSISQYRHLPITFLWTLPTRTRQATSMLRDGLSYTQVAEIMGLSGIEGLVGGVADRFEEWADRPGYVLSEKDLTVLSHGKWRVDAIQITRMRLLGYQSDIVAWKLGIDADTVSKAVYVILKRLPHLRPAFQR